MTIDDHRQSDPLVLTASVWFWAAIAIGIAIRFYLVIFTEGTLDVAIWERHARDVATRGLTGYYHADDSANHPPFISEVESLLVRCADVSGIPFRILLRAPFILGDAGIAFLLLSLLWPSPWRFIIVTCYWLNPLSLIFSAYHGNTDCAVAFFLLLCVWLLSRGRIAAAGFFLGVSFWIKLPGVLAIPALIFFIQGWKRRFVFLVVVAVSAIFTYVPALIQDASIVCKNVLGYHGLSLRTGAGEPIWGPRVLLFSIIAPPEKWPEWTHAPILFFLKYGTCIGIALLIALSWLRRNRRSTAELCATIASIYVVLYSLSDEWTFQYFAWSVPFWFFRRPWFFVPAIVLAGGYIYSLYWFLCGNGWLLGTWDFFGHRYWPSVVMFFRNSATLFLFVAACFFLGEAIYGEVSRVIKATSNGQSNKTLSFE